MSTEYAEQERAFVSALSEETGSDLDTWMHQIYESKLSERNDIIDWLRHRGFTFARASWLERIHHNGGRLIYGDHASQPAPTIDLKDARHELTTIAAPTKPTARESQLGAKAGDIAAALAAAKGLRPLAEMILRELEQVVPGLVVSANPPFLALAAPETFAALLPEAKTLKLYADFGVGPPKPAKPADAAYRKSSNAFPAVIEINDARRVDAAFLTLIKSANTRVNG